MLTPNQHEIPFVVAAARLSRAAPTDWQQFVDAASLYANQQALACIQSPMDILPVAQGRAQNAHRLATLLAECRSLADKIEGR